MLAELRTLLILQERDRKIRAIRAELKQAPLDRKAFETKAAQTSSAYEAAKLRAKTLEMERKSLENDAQAKRDQIQKYSRQRAETRKNEEYTALTREIEHCEAAIRGIEDRELELMDAIESHKAVLATAEKEQAEGTARVKRQLQAMDEKTALLASELAGLEEERKGVAAPVDEELLSLYERLFVKKDGLAVAALAGEICQGCHMKVTAQIIHSVKAERTVTHCVQCGRILYLER
jgi:predicted  nucleic acid-binding Zn-ribbon protein